MKTETTPPLKKKGLFWAKPDISAGRNSLDRTGWEEEKENLDWYGCQLIGFLAGRKFSILGIFPEALNYQNEAVTRQLHLPFSKMAFQLSAPQGQGWTPETNMFWKHNPIFKRTTNYLLHLHFGAAQLWVLIVWSWLIPPTFDSTTLQF